MNRIFTMLLALTVTACAGVQTNDGATVPDPRDTYQRQVDCGDPETVAWMLADGTSWHHEACCGSFHDSLAPHLHHDPLRLTHDLRMRTRDRAAACTVDADGVHRDRIYSGS